METAWKHRTQTGRVVYDRPKNIWSFKDVNRILAAMDRAGQLDSADRSQLWELLNIIADRLINAIASGVGVNLQQREIDAIKSFGLDFTDKLLRAMGVPVEEINKIIGEFADGFVLVGEAVLDFINDVLDGEERLPPADEYEKLPGQAKPMTKQEVWDETVRKNPQWTPEQYRVYYTRYWGVPPDGDD